MSAPHEDGQRAGRGAWLIQAEILDAGSMEGLSVASLTENAL